MGWSAVLRNLAIRFGFAVLFASLTVACGKAFTIRDYKTEAAAEAKVVGKPVDGAISPEALPPEGDQVAENVNPKPEGQGTPTEPDVPPRSTDPNSKEFRPIEDPNLYHQELNPSGPGQSTRGGETAPENKLPQYAPPDIMEKISPDAFSKGKQNTAPAPSEKPLERIQEKPLIHPDPNDMEASTGEPSANSVVESGIIRSSIYYIYSANEDKRSCGTNVVSINNEKGALMMKVCPSTLAGCEMQGTCQITKGGKTQLLNVVSKRLRRYKVMTGECVYGLGVKGNCLDPFYNVAADPDHYKTGSVIFVPAIRGLELPNGKKHHGYLIVRDIGDNTTDKHVKGPGRFDFFSGNMHYLSKENPFARLGLGNRKTNLQYQRVEGPIAEQVRMMRGYPKLPKPPKDRLPNPDEVASAPSPDASL